jgi:CHAT domain-containing protein/Tfp pilus assembly protein PilF
LASETLVRDQNTSAKNQLIGIIKLENEAGNLFSAGQSQAAIDKYQQALVIARKIPNRQRTGKLLQDIGLAYSTKEQYQKALDFYQQALIIWRETSNLAAEGTTLDSIGVAYFRQGQYTKALAAHQQALEMSQKLKRPVGVGLALANIGTTYTKQGKYAEALALYRQALENFQQVDDNAMQGRVLDKMGLTYAEQGNYEEALKTYEKALLSFTKGAIAGSITGGTLKNIGLVYASKGEYQKALSYYEDSLTAHRSAFNRNRAEQGATISSQGLIASYLGQYPNALESYKNALAIYREFGYRASEGEALSMMGDAYASQKDFSKAMEFYQQALLIHDEVGNLPGKITTLSSLGAVYSATNNPRALETHQQALKIAQQVGSLPRTSQVLNYLGQTQIQQGKLAEAQTNLQQAIATSHKIGNTPVEAQALSSLGLLLAKQNQPELAIAFYKQSVNTYEGIRTGIRSLSKEQQDAYTRTITSTYRQLADILIQQGRISEAQQVLELLKIQEINDFTKGTRAPSAVGKVELTPIETQIRDRYGSLIAFGQKLADCEQTNCTEKATLRSQQNQLQAAFNALVKDIRDRALALRAQQITTGTDEFTSNASAIVDAQPHTLLIYPLVLPDKVQILWATKAEKEGAVLGGTTTSCPLPETKLNELVGTLQAQITDRGDLQALQTTSREIYNCLIAPLEPELKKLRDRAARDNTVPNLVFVPDRATNLIPMSVLFDGKHYLIERYNLSNILSVSNTDASASLPDDRQNISVVGFGLSEAKPGFNALDYVPVELNSIIKTKNSSAIKGIYNGNGFLNQQFTRDTLKENIGGHTILHIATHGVFRPSNPRNSFLLLGDGSEFEISDVQHLKGLSSVHLVVLSACETAKVGTDTNGTEVAGISSFFLQKRAKAVLASLWKVNDPATSLLMQQFYQQLANGTTKATALRQVQLDFIQGKFTAKDAPSRSDVTPQSDSSNLATRSTRSNFSHPYYWAPFILIGNSR